MRVATTKSEVREVTATWLREGRTIGFVPTMGYLHAGHLSLIRIARQESAAVAVSIYVNPLQFGRPDDLSGYPRDVDRDLELCEKDGVDLTFVPDDREMYPAGEPGVSVSAGRLGEIVEGLYRPGHFAGALTVCAKLFHIMRPDRAYFGMKDAQQLAAVRQMVTDLDFPMEIVACPTVRESDGLAMSSRNVNLSPEERRAARVLSKALFEAEGLIASGERSSTAIEASVRTAVESEPLVRLEYVELVDEASFERTEAVTSRVILALSAYLGPTRLIDNVFVRVGTPRGPERR